MGKPRLWRRNFTGQAASRVDPCTNRVILALEHTVDAGSFGVITETLTKGDDAGEDTDGEETDGEDTDGGDTEE